MTSLILRSIDLVSFFEMQIEVEWRMCINRVVYACVLLAYADVFLKEYVVKALCPNQRLAQPLLGDLVPNLVSYLPLSPHMGPAQHTPHHHTSDILDTNAIMPFYGNKVKVKVVFYKIYNFIGNKIFILDRFDVRILHIRF
jgi:hypothetical protein